MQDSHQGELSLELALCPQVMMYFYIWMAAVIFKSKNLRNSIFENLPFYFFKDFYLFIWWGVEGQRKRESKVDSLLSTEPNLSRNQKLDASTDFTTHKPRKSSTLKMRKLRPRELLFKSHMAGGGRGGDGTDWAWASTQSLNSHKLLSIGKSLQTPYFTTSWDEDKESWRGPLNSPWLSTLFNCEPSGSPAPCFWAGFRKQAICFHGRMQ